MHRDWLRVLLLVLTVNLAGLGFGSVSQAKDLTSRMGVGYTDQMGLGGSLPSLAIHYFPNPDYGLVGSVGIDTEKNQSRFGFMAKILKVVFKEDNLNFYTGAAAGLVSRETNSKNDSGFILDGLVGCEFFMPGLENLSFSFEAGVGVTSISSEVRFRTIGDSPLQAGITFYF